MSLCFIFLSFIVISQNMVYQHNIIIFNKTYIVEFSTLDKQMH